MIVGLEWVSLGLAITVVLCLVCCFIAAAKSKPIAGIFAALWVVLEIASLALSCALSNAKANVTEHYIDYLKLQVQVAKYDDLDMLEQYKVRDDVMTYNLWYERNKSDLKNEWTFKGTSNYAKEFDYISIGG